MYKASIILVAPHVLLRQALRRFIQKDPGLCVVNEAGDGVELLRLLEATVPDVVVMDISIPRLSGLEASVKIKHHYPEVKVVLLSMHLEKEYLFKAIEIGVEGYVIKQEIDNINIAINTVLEGKRYLSRTFV